MGQPVDQPVKATVESLGAGRRDHDLDVAGVHVHRHRPRRDHGRARGFSGSCIGDLGVTGLRLWGLAGSRGGPGGLRHSGLDELGDLRRARPATIRSCSMRAAPNATTITAPRISENSRATASGRWPLNTRKVTSTVAWFCRMKTRITTSAPRPITIAVHP